jgi:hypothetical protein
MCSTCHNPLATRGRKRPADRGGGSRIDESTGDNNKKIRPPLASGTGKPTHKRRLDENTRCTSNKRPNLAERGDESQEPWKIIREVTISKIIQQNTNDNGTRVFLVVLFGEPPVASHAIWVEAVEVKSKATLESWFVTNPSQELRGLIDAVTAEQDSLVLFIVRFGPLIINEQVSAVITTYL